MYKTSTDGQIRNSTIWYLNLRYGNDICNFNEIEFIILLPLLFLEI